MSRRVIKVHSPIYDSRQQTELQLIIDWQSDTDLITLTAYALIEKGAFASDPDVELLPCAYTTPERTIAANSNNIIFLI